LLLGAATREQAALLLVFHCSRGIAIWFVTACRFAWRTPSAHLTPFPAGMPNFQRALAKLKEYGLYALLILQPFTGLAEALWRGRPFQLFLWQRPRHQISDGIVTKSTT
jgi:superoxide oxidase